MKKSTSSIFDPALIRPAIWDSFKKLDPRVQWRSPVMFVVLIGAVWTSGITIFHFSSFNFQITLWLWFTLLFANFAEAMAEGRGKAQAAALRRMRTTTMAPLPNPLRLMRRMSSQLLSHNESATLPQFLPLTNRCAHVVSRRADYHSTAG